MLNGEGSSSLPAIPYSPNELHIIKLKPLRIKEHYQESAKNTTDKDLITRITAIPYSPEHYTL